MVSTFRFLTGVTLVGAFCFAQPAVPPHPPVPPVPPAVEMRGLLTMSGRSYLGVNVKEIDSKRSKELGLSDEPQPRARPLPVQPSSLCEWCAKRPLGGQ